MNLLKLLFRTSRTTVFVATLASIIGGLSTVGVLILVRRWMIERTAADTSSVLIWGFVGVCLGALLSKLLAQVLLIGLSRRAMAQLTMKTGRAILAAPLKRLEHLGTTRLQITVTQEVPTIVHGLNAIPVVCADLAIVCACLVYLATISLPAFGVVAGVFAIGLPIQMLISNISRRHQERVREGQEGLLGRLRHLLDGIKELKIHRGRREAFLNQSLQASVQQQERQGYYRQLFRAIASTWGRMLMFLILGLLLIVLPAYVETDARSLGSYVLVVFFMIQPMGSLKTQLPQLSQARAALERVEAIGMDLSAIAERGADRAVRPLTSWEQVELVNVTYLHRGQGEDPSFTLGPINLTFKPGELVFLGGGNGSGKTTFGKLLTGLYVPREGEIRLNGQTVRRAALERYRQLFSVIFSEFHLFSELHGLSAPDLEDKARAYLKLFQLDNRVSVSNGAFSTTTRLSSGQRKRLALLVAYLEDRPFYIFDEWAADQDPHFKEVFYTQLLPELKARGKAVLAITHDDRYYHIADRLLLLEDGKLRSHGDPIVVDPSAAEPAMALPEEVSPAKEAEPAPIALPPEAHPVVEQNGSATSQLPEKIQVP